MTSSLLVAVGLILLTLGAELLVRGASALARAVGLPSLIIGLTVVAFGTSAPEFAVSMKASLAGQPDLAVGNVIGSNTFNVLFILGVSAPIVPLAVSSQLVHLDVPVMIAVSALNLWQGQLQVELEALTQVRACLAQVQAKLDSLGQANMKVQLLQTIPGVGPRLSEAIVAIIDNHPT